MKKKWIERDINGNDILRYKNMQLYACNKMWQKYEKFNKILVRLGTTTSRGSKVWSHHIYTIGSNKSPFSRGGAQIFLLLFFTFDQIWLSPIRRDHQPIPQIWKQKLWLGTSKSFI
jgi:hypothetical protein